MGHLGNPKELTPTVVFLASEAEVHLRAPLPGAPRPVDVPLPLPIGLRRDILTLLLDARQVGR